LSEAFRPFTARSRPHRDLAKHPRTAPDGLIRQDDVARSPAAVATSWAGGCTFLDHVRDDRLYAAWLLLVTTGMRRGELAGLRWAMST
jgi:integrase